MTLWQFERRWAATIGRALFPAGVFGGLTDGRDLGAAMGELVRRVPWYGAIVVRVALWAVWLGPAFAIRRLRTFGGLDGAARVLCLEQLMYSDVYLVRELLKILKLNVCFALLGDEKVLAHLGAYDLGDYRLHDDSDEARRGEGLVRPSTATSGRV